MYIPAGFLILERHRKGELLFGVTKRVFQKTTQWQNGLKTMLELAPENKKGKLQELLNCFQQGAAGDASQPLRRSITQQSVSVAAASAAAASAEPPTGA